MSESGTSMENVMVKFISLQINNQLFNDINITNYIRISNL